MADFCRVCTGDLFGPEYADRNDMRRSDLTAGMMAAGLCEGCGPGYFDGEGKRVEQYSWRDRFHPARLIGRRIDGSVRDGSILLYLRRAYLHCLPDCPGNKDFFSTPGHKLRDDPDGCPACEAASPAPFILLRLCGQVGPCAFRKRSPALYAWRLWHYLTGPLRGCSCTRCHKHRWRFVPAAEIYRDRKRTRMELERLHAKVAALEERYRGHTHEYWSTPGGPHDTGEPR